MLSGSALQAQEAGRFDVFGGFSYLRFNALKIGYPDDANLYGANLQGAVNIKLKLAAVIDLSGDYGSQIQAYHFMIGPQYTWRRDKSNIFVQGLFGKAQNRVDITQPTRSHFESVGRSFGVGVGYDYHWKDRIDIRVIQLDYFHSNTFGTGENDYRASTGIVVHFGHIGHRRRL